MTAVKFLAHLVNQQVLHELVALEVLTLLLEDPTDDSVEVAVGFLKVHVHVHVWYGIGDIKLYCSFLCLLVLSLGGGFEVD